MSIDIRLSAHSPASNWNATNANGWIRYASWRVNVQVSFFSLFIEALRIVKYPHLFVQGLNININNTIL